LYTYCKGQLNQSIDQSIDSTIDGWMDGWVDGWMDRSINQSINFLGGLSSVTTGRSTGDSQLMSSK